MRAFVFSRASGPAKTGAPLMHVFRAWVGGMIGALTTLRTKPNLEPPYLWKKLSSPIAPFQNAKPLINTGGMAHIYPSLLDAPQLD